MIRKFLIVCAATLGILTLNSLATDAIYKWIDEDGVTHFSAQPPVDRDYVRLHLGSSTRGQVPSAADSTRAPESDQAVESRADSENGEGDAADQQELAESCEQARWNLEQLTQPGMLRYRDYGGEERDLADDERDDVIAETREFIERWC